jgi:hypothetical protein
MATASSAAAGFALLADLFVCHVGVKCWFLARIGAAVVEDHDCVGTWKERVVCALVAPAVFPRSNTSSCPRHSWLGCIYRSSTQAALVLLLPDTVGATACIRHVQGIEVVGDLMAYACLSDNPCMQLAVRQKLMQPLL